MDLTSTENIPEPFSEFLRQGRVKKETSTASAERNEMQDLLLLAAIIMLCGQD